MSELARRIILAHPAAYFLWLKTALKDGLRQLFEHALLEPPGHVLLLALAACQTLLIARRRKRRLPERAAETPYLDRNSVFLIALTFALAKLSLVVLVEPPLGRYVAPAAVFFPAWLAVLIVDRIERLQTA